MTISPERERQLLASVAYRSDSLRAIQFLLTRVRELEAEIAATDILLVSLNDREDELTRILSKAIHGGCVWKSGADLVEAENTIGE